MIKKEADKYVLYSKDGEKKLGEFDTEEEAKAREEEILRAEHAEEEVGLDQIRQAYDALAGNPGQPLIVERGADLFEVPYSIAGEEVTFGKPKPVKIECVSVTEAIEMIGEPTGKKWEVRVIREGVSKRHFIYTRHALESLLPYIDGAKVLAIESIPGIHGHAPAGGTVAREEVGTLANPRGVEIDGTYEIRADLQVKEGWIDKIKSLVKKVGTGLSIDAPVEGLRVKEALVWVKKFLGLESVDLATYPGAGGAFLRATEAVAGEEVMDELLKLIKAKRPDLAEKLGDSPTMEQVMAVVSELLSSNTATAKEADEMRGLLQQSKKDSCDAYLTRKLTESNLPDPVKKKVEKKFSGQIFAREALDTELTAEKETLDQLMQSGAVRGAGDTRVEMSQEAVDKTQIALDRTLGVKVEGNPEIKAFRGIRQAYVQITGDSDISGRLPAYKMRAQEAILSADFPKLLDRTMNRRVVQDYAEVDYGERRIISFSGATTDFKTQEANRIGYFGDLSLVDPEVADYTEAVKPGEESITYKPQTRGNILTITRVTLMNDDLSGILRRVRGWGRSARRTFARFVWNFWINNSTYDGDATAWFTSGHGNLKTQALAAAELVDAITKLMNMTEPNSGEKLGLNLLNGGVPALGLHLVVPTTLWDTAKKENGREYLDASFTPNAAYQAFGANGERIIVNPLLTDITDWGIFANPDDRDIIEVKFVNGQEEPEIFLADQPTVGQMFVADKIQYKIRHEYGGDILDFRGAVKSVVA